MSKVIFIKTGEVAGDSDIRVMLEVDLMNQLVKTQKLLRDRGYLTEATGFDSMIGQVKNKVA